MYYVYELRYPDGTPFYVGKGKGDRCNHHMCYCDNKNPLKKNIINKIRKSNEEPIIKKVAENLTEFTAFQIEKFLIAYYGKRIDDSGKLANIRDGGEGGSGYKHTEEAKRKTSESNRGRKHSEECKRKMSERMKETPLNYWKGKKRTEETLKKMRKPIEQYSIKGKFIAKYDSIKDAGDKLNMHTGNIPSVCSGKRKSAGGYIWRYV